MVELKKKQINDVEKAVLLYKYFNELDKDKKWCNYSISTKSQYHYFIKDGQLYEVRISDHQWHIALSGKLGYTISNVCSSITPVPINSVFIPETNNVKGIVVDSNVHLTTVQYGDENQTVYATQYVVNCILYLWKENMIIKEKNIFKKLLDVLKDIIKNGNIKQWKKNTL